MTLEQKGLIIGTLGTWASIVALAATVPTLAGIQVSIRVFVALSSVIAIVLIVFFLSGSKTKLYRRIILLFRRAFQDVSGSSKRAFMADGMRLLAFFGLGTTGVLVYRWNLMPIHYRVFFLVSLGSLYTHSLIYPFFSKRTKWDSEYRLRKLTQTAAIDSAIACIQDSLTNNRIRNIEVNALHLVKSYLEFTVSDSVGKNFTVNLLVLHPHASGRLVCIQRSSGERPFPRVYEDSDMHRARLSLDTGEVYYDGNYSREDKEYKMVWHVPISSPHSKQGRFIGLLCVDSRKRRHLDLNDDRKALLLNLSPYISLLGYALALRYKFNKWEPIK
jgi:hypothetical protein